MDLARKGRAGSSPAVETMKEVILMAGIVVLSFVLPMTIILLEDAYYRRHPEKKRPDISMYP